MERQGSARRMPVVALAASIGVLLVACSPQATDGNADVPVSPASGLVAVTDQAILDAAPAGVTPTGTFDEPADGGVVRFNAATRTFSAPTEAAAEAAAGHLLTDALADGWAVTEISPGGTGGVPTAVLTKGSLVLEISHTTEAYKQNWPSDDDGFEVRMVVTDEPTTTEIPVDGAS